MHRRLAVLIPLRLDVLVGIARIGKTAVGTGAIPCLGIARCSVGNGSWVRIGIIRPLWNRLTCLCFFLDLLFAVFRIEVKIIVFIVLRQRNLVEPEERKHYIEAGVSFHDNRYLY